MRTIEKKIRPEFFRLVKPRKKNVETRLADFKISAGDVLILKEWDPKKKNFTGRVLRRKVRAVNRTYTHTIHSPAEIKKYDLITIELK
ncbi:MAG: hypothetical protein A3H71_02255 [Candidatus Sungbacteria bacterium RIFCSPLOWO2_02_FULL_48_13b]|uniref:DUF3850 domain-containing protein n=2 Tax=Candidatus Sungiibacteriota TaxID=1817917 RepID=A0A1G2LG96_9BACT|nr:MAG: hypothetical protein A3C12_03140 [Candidatus Sungbacteria bacterium RIFCSPHIGHO2_02_FULL_49_20]OHA09839.1 MAG: hypothetical protein A3H71_02255 [Candidatus Sungbacteria bacterium RIFCSPLOWO2_02_FULL_48_13b]